MLNSIILQNKYQTIYSAISNYLWPIDVVEHIADFEIACYSAFPDMVNVRRTFDILRRDLTDVIREDSELSDAFDQFNEFISDSTDTYLPLRKVNEVV